MKLPREVYTLAAVAALLTAASNAHAHEGHGNAQWAGTALHYLLEPVHLPLTLAAAAAAAASAAVLVAGPKRIADLATRRRARR